MGHPAGERRGADFRGWKPQLAGLLLSELKLRPPKERTCEELRDPPVTTTGGAPRHQARHKPKAAEGFLAAWRRILAYRASAPCREPRARGAGRWKKEAATPTQNDGG